MRTGRSPSLHYVKAPLLIVIAFFILALPALRAVNSPPVVREDKGELTYATDAQGNRVPDFSHAGYKGGGVAIPDAPARVRLEPLADAGADSTAQLQAAIDHVSLLPADANGIRGAVVLMPGRYRIVGQLRLHTSGVIVRGAGRGADAATSTILVSDRAWERSPLIVITGKPTSPPITQPIAITDDYVPVGSRIVHVKNAAAFKAGERVRITRPGTAEWIKAVGMDVSAGRQPYIWRHRDNVSDIAWDRIITAVDATANALTFDAPVTTALEKRFGGATIIKVEAVASTTELTQIGIENLRCESTYDKTNPYDEHHAWIAVKIDCARDCWVRDMTALHFASSAVDIGRDASRITVQDCASLAPVSELGGYRRNAFLAAGQQLLFLRCLSEGAMHDFSAGYFTAGPNAFVECTGQNAHGDSGSIGSWAAGILFDNVTIDGAGIAFTNLETWNQGVGWNTANSMAWQCSAGVITCRQPPTAQNWASGAWAQFVGNGHWDQVNEYIKPLSLYRTQLAARLGKNAETVLARAPYESNALTQNSVPTLAQLQRDGKFLTPAAAPKSPEPGALTLRNGWLVLESKTTAPLITGKNRQISWWRGQLAPDREEENGTSLTRYVPGRFEEGMTDDIPELVTAMRAHNEATLRHHYGLWYERRRDDHERVRRPNSEVWPPFFDQPFARSGQGTAWDGLSKYDLTKYNLWYFGRLRQFAAIGRDYGVVLINEMFFQHNILEAGAHWVDTPWRAANSLQDMGFPEPVPFTEGGKRILMADTFYDISHPVRREIFRAYIRQCLNNLKDEPNVIHTLTEENSGPLHFMQFWIDTVAEWEAETGKHPLIALSAPKDVQDAILADAKRAAVIDIIDLKYWWYTDKDTYAPPSAKNLAPRQFLRLWKGGQPSSASLARMIREYREKFPNKAIICDEIFPGGGKGDAWICTAAGVSIPQLPKTTDARLLAALGTMQPVPTKTAKQWLLADDAQNPRHLFAATSDRSGNITIDLTQAKGRYRVYRIDPATGQPTQTTAPEIIEGGRIQKIPARVVWLVTEVVPALGGTTSVSSGLKAKDDTEVVPPNKTSQRYAATLTQ